MCRATAHNYDLYIQGGDSHYAEAVDGTSASSPILAGIISQYNTVRIMQGLPPLGFLNFALCEYLHTSWPRCLCELLYLLT